MSEYAILDGTTVKRVQTFLEWAKWLEDNRDRRRLAADVIDGVRVSTVFLGLNHSWDDRPLWFETMIFEGPHDGYCERYTTYDDALEGHQKAVAIAKGEIKLEGDDA